MNEVRTGVVTFGTAFAAPQGNATRKDHVVAVSSLQIIDPSFTAAEKCVDNEDGHELVTAIAIHTTLVIERKNHFMALATNQYSVQLARSFCNPRVRRHYRL